MLARGSPHLATAPRHPMLHITFVQTYAPLLNPTNMCSCTACSCPGARACCSGELLLTKPHQTKPSQTKPNPVKPNHTESNQTNPSRTKPHPRPPPISLCVRRIHPRSYIKCLVHYVRSIAAYVNKQKAERAASTESLLASLQQVRIMSML